MERAVSTEPVHTGPSSESGDGEPAPEPGTRRPTVTAGRPALRPLHPARPPGGGAGRPGRSTRKQKPFLLSGAAARALPLGASGHAPAANGATFGFAAGTRGRRGRFAGNAGRKCAGARTGSVRRKWFYSHFKTSAGTRSDRSGQRALREALARIWGEPLRYRPCPRGPPSSQQVLHPGRPSGPETGRSKHSPIPARRAAPGPREEPRESASLRVVVVRGAPREWGSCELVFWVLGQHGPPADPGVTAVCREPSALGPEDSSAITLVHWVTELGGDFHGAGAGGAEQMG